jgi:hypothetical protein
LPVQYLIAGQDYKSVAKKLLEKSKLKAIKLRLIFLSDPSGYWLLVTGYWLLVTGYWLLVTGYWLLVFLTPHSSLLTPEHHS